MSKPLVEFTAEELASQLKVLAKAYENLYPNLKRRYLKKALTKTARPLAKIYKKEAQQRYPKGQETYVSKSGKIRKRRIKGDLEVSAGVGQPSSKSIFNGKQETLGVYVGFRRNKGGGYKAVWLARGTKDRKTNRGAYRGKLGKTNLEEVTGRKVEAQGLPKLTENLTLAYQQGVKKQLQDYDKESAKYKNEIRKKMRRR
jgi:hypothetical protein